MNLNLARTIAEVREPKKISNNQRVQNIEKTRLRSELNRLQKLVNGEKFVFSYFSQTHVCVRIYDYKNRDLSSYNQAKYRNLDLYAFAHFFRADSVNSNIVYVFRYLFNPYIHNRIEQITNELNLY